MNTQIIYLLFKNYRVEVLLHMGTKCTSPKFLDHLTRDYYLPTFLSTMSHKARMPQKRTSSTLKQIS